MKFMSVGKAAEITGYSVQTIRRWADEGIIQSVRTKGENTKYGHRKVDISNIMPQESSPKFRTICYCRVSSGKQKDDLKRQVEFMQEKFPEAEIVKDIGSGLNFKRKGLTSILERVLQGNIITLVVAYKDRLARFGFELIEWFIQQNGGKILVLDESSCSPEQELTKDLLTIIHVFSCRLHGLRKYKTEIKEDKSLPRYESEDDSEEMVGDI